AISYASSSHSASAIGAAIGLFVGMVLAEHFPVPVEGMDAGGVTLGFVFAVACICLFGWDAGVLVAASAPALSHLMSHRPPMRVAFNGAMFALAALASGLAIEPFTDETVGGLLIRVALAAFIYNWVVNLVLISGVISLDSGRPFFKLMWTTAKQTTAPFAL